MTRIDYINQSQTSRGQSNQARISNNNNKWVVNLPKTSLTPAQHSLLGKGPNFAVTPKAPPNVDYLSAIKSISHKLTEQDVQELKSAVNNLLKGFQDQRPILPRKREKL